MRSILEVTWEDIDVMDKKSTIIFLPIAPIEEHGKHLPLGVDIFLTEKWQYDTIKMIEIEYDVECAIFPCLPIGYANLGGFNGNFHVDTKTLFRLIYRSLKNIAEWGFQNIVILSGHAEPLHLITIEKACKKVNKKFGKIAFAPMGAIFSTQDKKDDSLCTSSIVDDLLQKHPNDFHAGWIETSAMLDINAALVKDSYMNMPDILVAPTDMMNSAYIAKTTQRYGHLGVPRLSSKEVGMFLNMDMARNLCFMVGSFYRRRQYEKYEHHFLYPMLNNKAKEIFFTMIARLLARNRGGE